MHFFPERVETELCVRVAFCVEDNPKWKVLTLQAKPLIPRLEFLPAAVLDLGHCLPSQTLKREVAIRNASEVACEVYSLEYDEQHRRVDAALRDFSGFDEGGVALLPLRCVV